MQACILHLQLLNAAVMQLPDRWRRMEQVQMYLLYWYKGTCLAGTKGQILTPEPEELQPDDDGKLTSTMLNRYSALSY